MTVLMRPGSLGADDARADCRSSGGFVNCNTRGDLACAPTWLDNVRAMPDDASVSTGTFSQVIETLNRLREDGVISQYAIVGAMAANLWDEPVATQDVDVAVVVAGDPHPLDPLRPVLDWLSGHGFAFDGEHALIAGVPVQFLPEWHPVITEGIETAAEVQYDPTDPRSPKLRVMRPTYLVASWEIDPGARSPRRRERAARLREAGLVDERLLADVMARYRK